jgi:hypothetical protein
MTMGNFFFRSPQIVPGLIGIIFSLISIENLSCKKGESPEGNSTPQLPYLSKAYIIQLSSETKPSLPANYDELLRFHFFGICWNGKNDDNLKFVKQMGYSYVFYRSGMENSSLAKDLFFYIEGPEYEVYSTLGINRLLSNPSGYSESQKNTYQSYFALKANNTAFPENMATGWGVSGSFCVEPDYQQQKVIDYFVSNVFEFANKKEKSDKKFLFAGLAWDVPQFTGDFWGGGKQVNLSYWNGKDSSALFPGCSHEYKTYSEGKIAYYLKTRQYLKSKFPERRLAYIFEPYVFYDFWFKELEKLEYDKQVNLMDNAFVSQECGVTAWATGTEFADDPRPFISGITRRIQVGSSTPDNHELASNKLIAGKAAINGSWFNWYGRFSGSGDKIPITNIYEVPNWLQLIRVAGNWDNLNGVPLSERKLTGSDYSSTNSMITRNIIYSRQPKTQKLFVTFLNDSGEVTLNPGEKIVSIKRVDLFFIETVDGGGDLKVDGNKIKLKSK